MTAKIETTGMGLSCIENHFLSSLPLNTPAYRYIFYESYVPAKAVYDAFTIHDAAYADWRLTPRLHITAQRLGMAQYEFQRTDAPCVVPDWHTAIRVKPTFMFRRYGVTLWRNDHYILVRPIADGLYPFCNDTPQDKGYLSPSELQQAFDGAIFRFRFLYVPSLELQDICRRSLYQAICKDPLETLPFSGEESLEKLRDFVGVLRVLRKRLTAIASEQDGFSSGVNYIALLNRLYLRLAYWAKLGKQDVNTVRELLSQLQLEDQTFIKNLKKEMAILWKSSMYGKR